jgi:hypothetical protein
MSAHDHELIISGEPIDPTQGGGGGKAEPSAMIPSSAYAPAPEVNPETKYSEAPQIEQADDVLRAPDVEFGATHLDRSIADLINGDTRPGQEDSIYLASPGAGLRAPAPGSIRLAFVKDGGSYQVEAAHSDHGSLRRKIDRFRSKAVYEADDLGDISTRCKLIGHIESGRFILNVGQNELVLGSVNGTDIIFTAGTHYIQSNQFRLKGINIATIINAPQANLAAATVPNTDQHVQHNNCHRIRVNPGSVRLIKIDGSYSLLEGRAEPYTFRHRVQFAITDATAVGTPEVSLDKLTRLYLRKNQVAALSVNGRPEFVAGTDAPIYLGATGESVTLIKNSDYPFYPANEPVIRALNLVRLFVPQGQIAMATANGVAYALEGTGTEVILGNDRTAVDLLPKSDAEVFYHYNDLVIDGRNFLRLRIPPRQIAAVITDGQGELISGSTEPVYRAGNRATLLTKDDDTPFFRISDPVIVAQRLTRLMIPTGKLATAWTNGQPDIIAGTGEAVIYGKDDQVFKFVAKPGRGTENPFYDLNEPVIQIGNLVRLRIPAGQIATVRIDGKAEFLPGPNTTILGKEKPVEFKPKPGDNGPFYSVTDPVIRLDTQVRLNIPAGKVLPCTVDGTPQYLTATCCEAFNKGSYANFQAEEFIDLTTKNHKHGYLTWLSVQANDVVVVRSPDAEKEAEGGGGGDGDKLITALAHDDALPVGCYIVDGRKHQLIGVINTGQQELHIPHHDERAAAAQDEPDFQCDKGLKVRVRGEIFFEVRDPIKLARRLNAGVSTNKIVYDIVISDLRKTLAGTPYDQISGNIRLTGVKSATEDEQDQGWQERFKAATGHDLEEYGIHLNAFRATECTLLDPEAARSVKEGADTAAAMAAKLQNMEATRLLSESEAQQRLLSEQQQQEAALQAQTAELKQQLAEQQAAIQQQQLQQEAHLRQQQIKMQAELDMRRTQLQAEIAAAKAQAEIAALQQEAAMSNAEARFATENQEAKLIEGNPKFAEFLLAKAKFSMEVAIAKRSVPLRTLEAMQARSMEGARAIAAASNGGVFSRRRASLEDQLFQAAASGAAMSRSRGGGAGE